GRTARRRTRRRWRLRRWSPSCGGSSRPPENGGGPPATCWPGWRPWPGMQLSGPVAGLAAPEALVARFGGWAPPLSRTGGGAAGVVVEWGRLDDARRTRILTLACDESRPRQEQTGDFASVASVASRDAKTPGKTAPSLDATGRNGVGLDATPDATHPPKTATQ